MGVGLFGWGREVGVCIVEHWAQGVEVGVEEVVEVLYRRYGMCLD